MSTPILGIRQVNDVEILRPWNGELVMLVSAVTESGEPVELRFKPAGYQKIWEFLSIVRGEVPAVLGVQ